MRTLSVLVLLTLLAGCDALTGATGYREQVVVSASLEADAPFPPIQVTRTVPLDQAFDPDAPVSGAVVTVTRLAGPAGPERAFAYRVAQGSRFTPEDGAVLVEPGATYRLEVRVPGQAEPVTAETTVPGRFDVVRPPPQTIAFGTGQGPEVAVSRSAAPGRQAMYLLRVRALAPDSFAVAEVEPGRFRLRPAGLEGRFGLTPFYADVILGRDCTVRSNGSFSCPFSPSDAASGTSPLLNEASLAQGPGGTLLVRAPWLAFGYYGPQELTISALDDALVAFVETQATQQPGGTLSPGEIPNIATNVRGGLGVFGSYASQRVQTTVVP